MPLNELILVTRCADPKGTANLMRAVSIAVFQAGGIVRDVNILGDRIMAHTKKGNDGKLHSVGRYIQILYDGNPRVVKKAEIELRDSFETIQHQTYRVKDFFNEALLFKKSREQTTIVKSDKYRRTEFVSEIAKIMRGREDPNHYYY
eukprot:TRINITY_DN7375_c0_g1_i4.p1 TRINITY_DN7375_c0_g1~~TRINITY_DN7375_c0_g1_i4.p1  ORF type:complete len:147 (-),score=25.64 TRINITY_DN7375_c0_g1_i4:147-587(-)